MRGPTVPPPESTAGRVIAFKWPDRPPSRKFTETPLGVGKRKLATVSQMSSIIEIEIRYRSWFQVIQSSIQSNTFRGWANAARPSTFNEC